MGGSGGCFCIGGLYWVECVAEVEGRDVIACIAWRMGYEEDETYVSKLKQT